MHDQDVFKGLDALVKNFLVSVPLIADLRSPAMRERHWQQLMEANKVRARWLLRARARRCCCIVACLPPATLNSLLHFHLHLHLLPLCRPGLSHAQVSFNVADPGFRLGDLLALQLHKFEEEVGEIVDRAQKEEKMEAGLGRLAEVWAKVAFAFTPHKDSGVALVKMADEDFEVRRRWW